MKQVTQIVSKLVPTRPMKNALQLYVQHSGSRECDEFTEMLLDCAGPENIMSVLFYGSHKSDSKNSVNVSLLDFYVVVKDSAEREVLQRIANRNGHQLKGLSHSGFKMRVMSKVLAPLIVDFVEFSPQGNIVKGAKFCLITEGQLKHYLSDKAPDSYQLARFSQLMRLCYPRTTDGIEQSVHWFITAARRSFDFASPVLPREFTTEQFLQNYLQLSYRAECRPESTERVHQLVASEATILIPVYEGILRERAEFDKRLDYCETNQRFVFHQKPLHFYAKVRHKIRTVKSQIRAMLRWLKNMVTVDSWKEYVIDKIERSVDVRFELNGITKTLWPLALPYFVFAFVKAKRQQTKGLDNQC